MLQPGDLGLELEHPLDPGQVEALVGELLDAAEALDVLLAVAAAAAAGAGRVDQALALVDAQGLRVHAGQLGRHRDDVDGCGCERCHRQAAPSPPRCARAATGVWRRPPAPRPPGARRRDSFGGHRDLDGDEQVARAPFGAHAPALHPERAARAGAGRDAQGHRPPSSVGTLMSAPRAASGNVTAR